MCLNAWAFLVVKTFSLGRIDTFFISSIGGSGGDLPIGEWAK